MRLRQICVVVPQVAEAAAEIESLLGVAGRVPEPPGVPEGRIIPIGYDFLGLRGGPGAWTIIVQAEEALLHRRRLADMGVRIVHEEDRDPDMWVTRYHADDCAGVSLEIDAVNPAFDHLAPECPWPPAGSKWPTEADMAPTTGLRAVNLQGDDPQAMGLLWSDLLDQPVFSHEGSSQIRLHNAMIRFQTPGEEPGPGIESIDLAADDPAGILEAAERLRWRTGERQVEVAGMRINLVDSVDL